MYPTKLTIDQWYDRHERVWITAVKDARGYQVGDALIDGNKASAAASKRFLQAQIKQGAIR